jgi:RNA polymerase sigma-70 factor (ECF subfamily)
MRRRSEFEAFYRQHKDPCFRALLASVRDPSLADELLAEAFTRALARWRDVRAHPAPAAWVVRTAINLSRDDFRRRRRAARLPASRSNDLEPDPPFDPVLHRAVAALPQRQREVVALRVLADLSTDDTAAALGITPGTVTTHLARGLAALRDQLSVRNEPRPVHEEYVP